MLNTVFKGLVTFWRVAVWTVAVLHDTEDVPGVNLWQFDAVG